MKRPAVPAKRIKEVYKSACHLDVTAMKPGNVFDGAPAHDMDADDFRMSAEVSAGVLARPGLGLGERIHKAVAATRARVGCNTNLGILLLCAPLSQACLEPGEDRDIPNAIQRILREADSADTEQVYAAIRLAAPGGLGASARFDVHSKPRIPLRKAMLEAADRDRIAGLYATGFTDLFDLAAPALARARAHNNNERAAVTDLFLFLLGRFPDSHVQRKHGLAVAESLSARAAQAHARWRIDPPEIATAHLRSLDAELKAARINPGTTADLTVATLFLDRLLAAADQYAGSECRHISRHLRLSLCGTPLISTLTS